MKLSCAFSLFVLAGVLSIDGQCYASDPAAAKLTKQTAVQQLTLRTLDSQPLVIGGDGQPAWTVFVFISRTCPIANAYQPRLDELQQKFASKGVRLVQVYVQRDITTEEAREHVREFHIKSPMILDTDRQLADALEAKVTPEAFLVDDHGRVRYRGRIDDQFAALGKKRPQPTRHDLETAIQECLAGASVSVPSTQPVGCTITK